MPGSNVVTFLENAGTSMTVQEGLAFIARSRRQLDRFAIANPAGKCMRIVPEYEAEIRAGLDELEKELLMTRKDS